MRQQRTRQVAASVALLVGGYFVYRYVKRNGKNAQWFDRIHLRAPKKEEIIIVKSSEDADAAAEAIIAANPACVGLDCEWVGKNKTALVQISAWMGNSDIKCFLFRLCHFDILSASKLLELLRHDKIVKLGVGIDGDMKKLAKEFDPAILSGVYFDLRHAATYTESIQAGGLASLVRQALNRKLDKDWRIRASNWEIDTLSEKQMLYAADDSLSALQVLAKFYGELGSELMDTIIGRCSNCDFKQKHVSTKQKTDQTSTKQSKVDKRMRREAKIKRRLEDDTSTEKHIKSFSARKAPLYNNHVYLEAPDGELLAITDQQKAAWYVKKGLGQLVEDSEKCYRVRLNFEPAGRPNSTSEKYYTTEKENQCVVCASTEQLIRKNVVPREYRKHFPTVMKTHVSHDIVLLCLKCHARSNELDFLKRASYGDQYNAPLGNDNVARANLESKDRKAARSAGNALVKNYAKLPESRRTELEHLLVAFFGVEGDFTMALAEEASKLRIMVSTDENDKEEQFQQHGVKVVSILQETGGIEALKEFEVSWRRHFLDVMKPAFMPSGWDVYHNHERIEVRSAREAAREADKLAAVTAINAEA